MTAIFDNAWYLSGPTAAGKTAIGIELAKRIGAEILSLDSMAIYRGMDIGTAKPSRAELASLPQHLIDLVEPADEFSIAQYLDLAEQTANGIAERGKRPLFVGGTALYLKALLRGIDSGPPADWRRRRELEEQARLEGPEGLHRQLQQVDPVAAAKLHPNDIRRVIRALEVHAATGQPLSAYQKHFARGRPAEACRVFVLDWPRDQLESRMRRRVDAMFDAGLVAEVEQLLAASADPSSPASTRPAIGRTASQAVGYREVLEHLRGERNLSDTIELVKLRTRQFAKRQLTWFRGLTECRWIAVSDPLDPAAVAEQIANLGQTVPDPNQPN